MSNQLAGLLPSVVGLGSVAMVAAFLTHTRVWAEEVQGQMRGAVQLALVTTLLQAAHFAEELSTGFEERFPALFGLSPIPSRGFVAFNIVWLVIWGLSVWGLARRRRLALFPLWFLAIASIVNGIAHPGFALFEGSYFPGLLTAPVTGAMGVLLLRRLLRITRPATLASVSRGT
jgi:hypothetical protein